MPHQNRAALVHLYKSLSKDNEIHRRNAIERALLVQGMPFYEDALTGVKYSLQENNTHLLGGMPPRAREEVRGIARPDFSNLKLLTRPIIVTQERNGQGGTRGNPDDQTFLARIDEAARSAERVRNRDIVLFVGITGTGKSTTINFLNDVPLVYEEIYFDEPGADGNPVLDKVHIGVDPNYTGLNARISAVRSVESETLYGAAYGSFVDSPGFEGTRGKDVSLIESIALRMLTQHARSIKIIFCISVNEIAGRGVEFRTAVERFREFFPDMLKHRQSILFLFTKPGNTTRNNIIQALAPFKNGGLEKFIEFIESNRDFLEVCRPFQKNHEKMELNRNNRTDISKIIDRLKAITTPQRLFQLSLTPGAKELLHGELTQIATEGQGLLRNYHALVKTIDELSTTNRRLSDECDSTQRRINAVRNNTETYELTISEQRSLITQVDKRNEDREDESETLEGKKNRLRKEIEDIQKDDQLVQVMGKADSALVTEDAYLGDWYNNGTRKEFSYRGNAPIAEVTLRGDQKGAWGQRQGGKGSQLCTQAYTSLGGNADSAWVEISVRKCDMLESRQSIRDKEYEIAEIDRTIAKNSRLMDREREKRNRAEATLRQLQAANEADRKEGLLNLEDEIMKKRREIVENDTAKTSAAGQQTTVMEYLRDSMHYFAFLNRVVQQIDDSELSNIVTIKNFLGDIEKYCEDNNINLSRAGTAPRNTNDNSNSNDGSNSNNDGSNSNNGGSNSNNEGGGVLESFKKFIWG
jgi:septal ring factor EnvC (AmiA/AmiB activator)